MTLGLPPAITASTGMDALCHAIECYTSKKGNPFSEMIASQGDRADLAQHPPRLQHRHRHRRAPRHAARRDVRRHVHRHFVDDGGACARLSARRQSTASRTASHAILLPFVMRFNAVGNEDKFRDVARWRWGLTSIQRTARRRPEVHRSDLRTQPRSPDTIGSQRWNITEADPNAGRRRRQGDAPARQQPAPDGRRPTSAPSTRSSSSDQTKPIMKKDHEKDEACSPQSLTPFDANGEVSPLRLRRQIRRQMEHGNGIFCNGTNGEFFVLTTDEKIGHRKPSTESAAPFSRQPYRRISTAATISSASGWRASASTPSR